MLCNKLLATLNDNKASMSEKVYNQYVGELEVLRSYYYYMLFDCFGRIPYLEEFVTTDAPLMEALWFGASSLHVSKKCTQSSCNSK